MKMYYIGGFVRDELLGRKSKDVDIVCTETTYPAMKEEILKRGGIIYQERPQFLTVKAKIPNIGHADFVVARKDGFYSDSRHPDSVEAGTLLDDQRRRDFTFNSIAKDTLTGS